MRHRLWIVLLAGWVTVIGGWAGVPGCEAYEGHAKRVFGASPPNNHLIYSMDPALMVGLNFALREDERQWLSPKVAALPVLGGWFGQGRSANMEELMKQAPDLVLLWGAMPGFDAVVSKISESGLAACHIETDTLDTYPAAYRTLGRIFDMPERGEKLAWYIETVLTRLARLRESVPEAERLTVYYAEGVDGLKTECDRSIHAEPILLAGGINPHQCARTHGYGMEAITFEQLLAYDPDVIITQEGRFLETVRTQSRFKALKAVREGRVYRIPLHPFPWFDRPPSFMRAIGAPWLAWRLYPDRYPGDIKEEIAGFYRLFFNMELDDAALEVLTTSGEKE